MVSHSGLGIITANVVSKQGDYTQQQDWGEDGAKKANKEELDITATTMAAGGGQKIVVLSNILFALLGYGAMYNQHTACLTNQVHSSTLTNVMLPSQSWTDAITMPHHVEWVRVCDPGPKEGGACHYAARNYPCQREEGRRHRLGPCQQKKLRPRDLNWSVLQSPNSEASQKQMYFAREQVHIYMNKQELELVQYYNTVKLCKNLCKYYVISTSICSCNTFTIKFVKVALLTPFEELLTRNRAMSLMLVFGAQISDVFAKNGQNFPAEKQRFQPLDLNTREFLFVKVTTDPLKCFRLTCVNLGGIYKYHSLFQILCT